MIKKNFFLITVFLIFVVGIGFSFSYLSAFAEECKDECLPEGEVQCVDNIHYQVCVTDFDDDPCLEWSKLYSCQGDISCGYQGIEGGCQSNERPRWLCEVETATCEYICEDDPSCRGTSTGDECSNIDESRCSDPTHKQTCGYYDDDPYLDWSPPESCTLDTSCGYQGPEGPGCENSEKPQWRCEQGECLYDCVEDPDCGSPPPPPPPPPSSCQNECPERWLTECVGQDRVRVCGYHWDDDPCLEWGPSKSCQISDDCGYGDCQAREKPVNWRCEQGECRYDCVLDEEACPEEPTSEYEKHSRKGCYDNDVYWFDSEGVLQDKEKDCEDDNDETIDGCKEGECFNISAEVGSSEYCEKVEHCGDGFCNCQEDFYTCFEDCESIEVEISTLAKKEKEEEWKEDISLTPKERFDVLLVIKNDSSRDFDDVFVKAEIPQEIIYRGQLKIDETFSAGAMEDIKEGINVGFLPSGSEKKVSFKGEVSSRVSPKTELKIEGFVEVENLSFSDSATINVEKAKKGVIGWLISKWWLWLILWIGFVVFLYWVLRRSSE